MLLTQIWSQFSQLHTAVRRTIKIYQFLPKWWSQMSWMVFETRCSLQCLLNIWGRSHMQGAFVRYVNNISVISITRAHVYFFVIHTSAYALVGVSKNAWSWPWAEFKAAFLFDWSSAWCFKRYLVKCIRCLQHLGVSLPFQTLPLKFIFGFHWASRQLVVS